MSDEYRQRSGNAILVKDDVGKAKPSVYDLPAEGHAYGRADPPDAEGAREVTMHWAAHIPRKKSGPDCQDFCKLNRMAAVEGVTSASQLMQWRSHNDVKMHPKGPEGALPKVIPSDVIPSFAYGRKSRPSTPISYVIGNQYAQEQEEALKYMYQKHAVAKDMPHGKRVIKLTVAEKKKIANARLARSLNDHPPPPQEPFKLTKFKNVKGKMSQAELGLVRGAKSVPSLGAPPPSSPAKPVSPYSQAKQPEVDRLELSEGEQEEC